MSPALKDELKRLEAFSCNRFFGQRVEPISPTTYKVDVQYIK